MLACGINYFPFVEKPFFKNAKFEAEGEIYGQN